VSEVTIRPARLEELEAIVRVGIAGFGAFEGPRAAADRREFKARYERCIERDPGGAWVAETDAGEFDGLAMATVREGIWSLASLAVHPASQGGGVGGALIRAAHGYGRDCRGFMIGADLDGRAWRLYSGLGLRIRPCASAAGTLDRSLLPALPGVREAGEDDVEELTEIDREIRGGGRAEDLVYALGRGERLYRTADGYAMGRDGSARMLVARRPEDAQALLWRVLADTPQDGEARAGWISAEQGWALGVCLAARLKPKNMGPYFVGGELGPLTPFLPHGALL
jgi:ribosomal protein S18 acetylase RimI-like enzyme